MTGPGLLLREIRAGNNPKVIAAQNVIKETNPDILLLTRFDYDFGLVALSAFAEQLRMAGVDYPYLFAFAPNAGVFTGADMDLNNRTGEARDAQGYGDFSGQGGMALLSRFPIAVKSAQDFSKLLWRDFAGAQLPDWPDDLLAIQRLSSVGHWDIPIEMPDNRMIHFLAYHGSTPAFNGRKNRNWLRNRDETLFWLRYLDHATLWLPPTKRFVVLGDANLDPADGDGDKSAIRALLSDPRLQDPAPTSAGAVEATKLQRGKNLNHQGDPALDTADLREKNGPGNLRLDYVIPSADLTVVDAGVFWPASDNALSSLLGERDPTKSWHALVWVDVRW